MKTIENKQMSCILLNPLTNSYFGYKNIIKKGRNLSLYSEGPGFRKVDKPQNGFCIQLHQSHP